MVKDSSNVPGRTHYLEPYVTKKQDTDKDKMKYSNNYNICLKCYINLCYVVASVMQGSKALAMAINTLL